MAARAVWYSAHVALGFVSSAVRAPRRHHGSTLVSLCCLVQLGSLASPVAADAARSVRLRYHAPASCPQRADVLRAIDAQLGAEFSTDTVLSARASVSEHAPGDFEVRIDYEADGGLPEQRRIHAESCAAAADATALVLAVALSPAQALATVETRAVPREPAPSASSAFTLGVLGQLDTALLPSPALAGALRVGLGLGPLQLHVSAALYLPHELSAAAVTLELEQWAVELGACYLTELGPLVLGPCARFELGRQIAEPSGNLEQARARGARFQAVGLGVELRLPLFEPVWLVLHGGAEWIARRPQFEVTGTGTLSSPAVFGARLGFGTLLIW